jgi:hypothetical protein
MTQNRVKTPMFGAKFWPRSHFWVKNGKKQQKTAKNSKKWSFLAKNS